MKRWIALGFIMVSMSGWSIVWADPDGQAEQKHQTAVGYASGMYEVPSRKQS